MIGVYDYTVILTYLSLLSAGAGIFVSLSGGGHPYLGAFFLMFCGLCDAFDGKVARTKKNRTSLEINFGIQIDSLCDVVAFGVLPASIGAAMLRVSPFLREKVFSSGKTWLTGILRAVLYGILLFYVLAALVRLAYFNVTEEERQKTEGGVRRYYLGVPVTTSALIFPTVLLLQYLVSADLTLAFFAVTLLLALAFVSRLRIPKPGLRGILIMVGIGIAEFAAMVLIRCFLRR